MSDEQIIIKSVNDKAGRAAFVDLGRSFAAATPHSVPQIRSELLELIDPAKNPFFGHARVQLFLAYRDGKPVGRISAHIDELALELPPEQGMGPGTGMFGYYDAADEAVGAALLERAEDWLREQGMAKALGPISMSIWEEPGLLIHGHDHPPMIMMGHHPAHYQAWIEGQGYARAKTLMTYDLDVSDDFPPLIQRIVKSGEHNDRIIIRPVDIKRWDEEVQSVLHILNDAWSRNWGFVPFTEREIAYAGKKLKPLIKPEINRIAELDGKPVAFMLTFPDINDALRKIDGKLLPFGWFHLLRWLRNPVGAGMRVPLMGVLKELQNSRLASQLAFMMISDIRKSSHKKYGTKRAEIGWILDDNQGMVAIANAIGSTVNREYAIYAKTL
uniref:GNAT family N-acetyltransferase n=1 Tax=Parerythrobacter lutipelagi TaxID=1964208 RepID=UPI0010F9E90A|nr:GNAT family N-acetyltransferase [Parerythrobacter lutipelagi]